MSGWNRRRPGRFALPFCLAVFASLLVACSDQATGPADAPVDPTDLGTPAGPVAQTGGGDPPGALSGTFGGGTELTGASPVTLGELNLDGPALVEVEARGIVPFYWAFGVDKGKQYGALDPGGHSTNSGNCTGNVVVTFSSGGPGGLYAPCDSYNALPLIEVWTDTLVTNGGTVEAWRASGPRNLTLRDCGNFGFPCFEMEGSQSVRVSIIADQLQVEADRAGVEPGTTVNFTASTQDGTPLEVREWIWVPDAPVEPPVVDVVPEAVADAEVFMGPGPSASAVSGDPAACGSAPTCQFPVWADGTMYVRAVAGGVVQQAGVGVSVFPDRLLLTTDSTLVMAGSRVTFTASTENGTPFEVTLWEWQPEVSDPPAETEPCGVGVNPCVRAVDESGTMVVHADVGGREQKASAAVEVIEPDLVLECEPSKVTRGEEVECTASTEPKGAQLEVVGWLFVGGGFKRTEATNENPWKGPIVVGGTIQVTADVQGKVDDQTAEVEVEARDWDDKDVPVTIREVTPPTGDIRREPKPKNSTYLGGFAPRFWQRPVGQWTSEVPSGPNHGLWYLTDVNVVYGFEVYVNRTALREQSEFWKRQYTSRRSVGGQTFCGRKDVVRFIDFVRKHEGIPEKQGGAFPTRSHAQLFEDEIEQKLGSALEPQVAESQVQVVLASNEPFDNAHAAASKASKKADPDNRFGCVFRYF